METKTRVDIGLQASRWILTVLLVGTYVWAYAWVLMLSMHHTKAGNIGLGVLTLVGILPARVLIHEARKIPWLTRWAWSQKVTFWTYFVLAVVTAWHLVGGLSTFPPDVQSTFVFAPISLLGLAAFLLVVRWSMKPDLREQKYRR